MVPHLHSFLEIFIVLLLYFKFWGACAERAGLLHRYTHAMVVCHIHHPIICIRYFSSFYPSPRPPPPAIHPLALPSPNRLQRIMFPSLCPCVLIVQHPLMSEHVVFGFLFLCQFSENDGFQLHPCPYKGHELIIFYGRIVFHGV